MQDPDTFEHGKLNYKLSSAMFFHVVAHRGGHVQKLDILMEIRKRQRNIIISGL